MTFPLRRKRPTTVPVPNTRARTAANGWLRPVTGLAALGLLPSALCLPAAAQGPALSPSFGASPRPPAWSPPVPAAPVPARPAPAPSTSYYAPQLQPVAAQKPYDRDRKAIDEVQEY